MTIFIHILTTYLSDDNSTDKITHSNKKYVCELNDLVLKKLINLGTNHKQEFKQVLNKWPGVKTKIENAFKLSANLGVGANSVQSPRGTTATVTSNSAVSSQAKAPKIQLKNFANFK